MGESKIITLTENQKKAVMSKSKRIAVIAGPGSGKTRVLTERICHLVMTLIEKYSHKERRSACKKRRPLMFS